MDGKRRNISNLPEDSPDKKIRRQNTPAQENHGESSTGTIVERLVTIWKAQANFPPVFTQEGSDVITLKQIEQKCISLEKVNKELQMKLASSEANVVKLKVDLINEGSQQEQLISKLNTVWDYMKSITETINYVTETMDETKGHTEHLRSQYNEVIVKVYADNEILMSEAEQFNIEKINHTEALRLLAQKECELVELKPKYQILHVEVESYKKKLEELGEDQSLLQKKIVELEVIAAEEKRRLEFLCAAETEKLNEQRHLHETEMQNTLKDLEGLNEKIEKLQEERNDVFRLLAEKEEEMKNFKQTVDRYKTNVEELKIQLTEKSVSFQRLNDEKAKCEGEIMEKNTQMSQFMQQLEAVKLDLSRKTANVTRLEQAKLELEQNIAIKEFESQETETKCGQVKIQMRKELEMLHDKLSQKVVQVQELQQKVNEAESVKESILTELSNSNVLLQAAQRENEDIKHKLTSSSSSKDLNKQLEEKQLKLTAENQELKEKYKDMEDKYQKEISAFKNKSQKLELELASVNSKLQQLEEFNEHNLKERAKFNEQFTISEQKLKHITKSDAQLKEKLQIASQNLNLAEQTIQNLNQKNQQLELKNKEIMRTEQKMGSVEKKADEFQQKYLDAEYFELDAAKLRVQEIDNKRFLTSSESFQKQQKDLEASERRARDFEQKYYALHALQKTEKQKFEKQQRLLKETEKKAHEFEEKFRRLEVDGLEFNKKLSGLQRLDPQLLSPSSWKTNYPVNAKRVTIVSDKALPLSTITCMPPPPPPSPTTKAPKPPVRSILKTVSSTPRVFQVPVSQRPKRAISPPQSSIDLSINPEKSMRLPDEPSRTSSPDSSEMIVDNDFDITVKKILETLSQEKSKSPKPMTTSIKNPRKFFKNRGSQRN